MDQKLLLHRWILQTLPRNHVLKKEKQEIKHEIELGHIEGLTVKDLEEITELKLVQIYSDIIFEREKHQFEISKQLLDIYTHEGKEDVEEITLPDKFNL